MLIALVALALSFVGPLIGYAVGRAQMRDSINSAASEVQTSLTDDLNDLQRRTDDTNRALKAEIADMGAAHESEISTIKGGIDAINSGNKKRDLDINATSGEIDALRDEVSALTKSADATTRSISESTAPATRATADLAIRLNDLEKEIPEVESKIDGGLDSRIRDQLKGSDVVQWIDDRIDQDSKGKFEALQNQINQKMDKRQSQ
jgi:predicted  nucleic acid-binding Zn-ribbon protein